MLFFNEILFTFMHLADAFIDLQCIQVIHVLYNLVIHVFLVIQVINVFKKKKKKLNFHFFKIFIFLFLFLSFPC